jgi:hypothetical protein
MSSRYTTPAWTTGVAVSAPERVLASTRWVQRSFSCAIVVGVIELAPSARVEESS